MTTVKKHSTLLGHVDTLFRLFNLEQENQAELSHTLYKQGSQRGFFERSTQGAIDLPRAQIGEMAGAFFAVFVPNPGSSDSCCTSSTDPPEDKWYERYIMPGIDFEYAQRIALAQTSRLFRLAAGSRGQVRVVRSVSEIESCMRENVLAAILHFEGAEAIDPQLDALDVFYQAGLRSLGLVWSRPNAFGYGVPLTFGHTPDTGPGLTDAGKALVRACNELGIMLDLSHLNEQGFWDVASISHAPLVATHSNAYAISNSVRNLTDRQLDAIKASDGLVGINFSTYDLRDDGKGELDAPIELIIRHLDYLIDRIGLDHVALGSDYDGATLPTALSDVTRLPDLFAELAAHSYDDDALQKIASENWLRVLRQTWRVLG